MLYGAWKNGGAHIFSVVKTENGVRLVDGQVADADVSSYLDGMHFGPELPATHKSWDIQIMRVDDLVPTQDVVHTSRPNTPAERELTEAWGRAGDGTGHFGDSLALPEQRIKQELAANDRWQARNNELIAGYRAIEADPSRPAAERARARDWADVLTDQNEALERGRMQFLQELADASTNRPGLNRIGVGGLMLTEEEQERIAGIVERGPGSGGQ